ncbi:MAG TPA: hypothetical protein PK990_03735 [Salinivirgaceae bacterium]|nr:hypothetical protein [Salinivirgaceae bacterium]
MTQSSLHILHSLGLNESEFPLELTGKNGTILISFYSKEIVFVDFEGIIDDKIIEQLVNFLGEFHYRSILQDIAHQTYLIIERTLSPRKINFSKIPFLKAVVNKNQRRTIQNNRLLYCTTLDEAILFVLSYKKQLEIAKKSDYYECFIERWFSSSNLVDSSTGTRYIKDPSWHISSMHPKMLASVDLFEGNILYLKIEGFINLDAVYRIIQLVHKVSHDVSIDTNQTKIFLIIDVQSVIGFSPRIFRFTESLLIRDFQSTKLLFILNPLVRTFYPLLSLFCTPTNLLVWL